MSISSFFACLANLGASFFFFTLSFIAIKSFCCVKQHYNDIMDPSGKDTEKEGTEMMILNVAINDSFKQLAHETIKVSPCKTLIETIESYKEEMNHSSLPWEQLIIETEEGQLIDIIER